MSSTILSDTSCSLPENTTISVTMDEMDELLQRLEFLEEQNLMISGGTSGPSMFVRFSVTEVEYVSWISFVYMLVYKPGKPNRHLLSLMKWINFPSRPVRLSHDEIIDANNMIKMIYAAQELEVCCPKLAEDLQITRDSVEEIQVIEQIKPHPELNVTFKLIEYKRCTIQQATQIARKHEYMRYHHIDSLRHNLELLSESQ